MLGHDTNDSQCGKVDSETKGSDITVNSGLATIMSWRTNMKKFWPLAIMAIAVIAFFTSGVAESFSLENLTRSYLNTRSIIESRLALSLAIFILTYIVLVAVAFPATWILTVGGGLVFGVWLGTLGTLIGATLGAIILYWVARVALSDFFETKAGKTLNKLKQGFQENEVNYMLFLRLVPAFPFLVVNFAPGILGVRFFTYTWTTFVGIMPGVLAYAWAGSGLASSIDNQFEAFSQCEAEGNEKCVLIDPSTIITTELILGFVAVGVASLIPVFVKKLRKNKPIT